MIRGFSLSTGPEDCKICQQAADPERRMNTLGVQGEKDVWNHGKNSPKYRP